MDFKHAIILTALSIVLLFNYSCCCCDIYSILDRIAGSGLSDGSFSTPHLYVYEGTLYIIYKDYENGYCPTVKKFNGSEWETVGTEGFYASQTSEDVISGSYYDLTDSFLYMCDGTLYAACGQRYSGYSAYSKATFMKYNDSNWEIIATEKFNLNDHVYDLSLCVNRGMPYMTYYNSENKKIFIKKYDGSSWEPAGFESSSFTSAELLLDPHNSTLYLFYREEENQINLMKYSVSGWETIDFSEKIPSQVSSTSLYVFDGIVYLTCKGKNGDYVIMKDNGSSWETLSSEGLLDCTYSLYVDKGIPYVLTYIDENVEKDVHHKPLYVKKYNGTSWETPGEQDFLEGYENFKTTLCVYNGTPYVAYPDPETDKAIVKKYNGTSWEIVGK